MVYEPESALNDSTAAFLDKYLLSPKSTNCGLSLPVSDSRPNVTGNGLSTMRAKSVGNSGSSNTFPTSLAKPMGSARGGDAGGVDVVVAVGATRGFFRGRRSLGVVERDVDSSSFKDADDVDLLMLTFCFDGMMEGDGSSSLPCLEGLPVDDSSCCFDGIISCSEGTMMPDCES